jgi:hypothetical protein
MDGPAIENETPKPQEAVAEVAVNVGAIGEAVS